MTQKFFGRIQSRETRTTAKASSRIFTVVVAILVSLVVGNDANAQTGFISLFAYSSPQVLRVCINSGPRNIDTLLSVTDGDGFGDYSPGQINFLPYTLPANGTLVATDSFMYLGGVSFPTSGLTYMPNPGFSGLDHFTVEAYDTYGSIDTTDVVVVVGLPPTAITAPLFVCTTGSVTFTDTTVYGTWTTADATATVDPDSGWVSGVSAGIATITYSTGCGADVSTTINVLDNSGTITGPVNVCPGSTITLTDDVIGGTWSASGSATVNPSGVVTGTSGGSAAISYSNGCGTAATWPITVLPAATVAAISGTLNVCQGGTATLTDLYTGGKWYSGNTGIAIIDSNTGIVSGVSGGTTLITYSISNICGSASITTTITINPYPTVAPITGTATVCPTASITLNSTTGSGSWSVVNGALASITSAGVVTGIAAGIDTVNYAVTNTCGTTTISYAITVNPVPLAGYIYGAGGVCVSGATQLTDAVSGGSWTSSASGTATVSAGLVSGVAQGVTTISYSYTNSCGTAVSTHSMRVSTDPVISTLAGNGTGGFSGDGNGASLEELFSPSSIARDNSGNLYIADAFNNRIRKINTNGIISTIAGTGAAAYSGDGSAATAAALNSPYGIAVDGTGNIYVSDQANQRIRKINTSGIISTVAGNGSAGYTSDGVAGTTAEVNYPAGIACDAAGNVYVADYFNNRVRQITTTGIISTVAGTGAVGYLGDGTAATGAKLNQPTGVAIDGSGNLLIADNLNNAVRMVNTSGIISTLAGNGTPGSSGDGSAATAALLNLPSGVTTDASGNIYIADKGNNRIRKITSGVIVTLAGNGTAGYTGDGNVATAAELYSPTSVMADPAGNIYIADNSNNVVRMVTPVCACSGTPSAGSVNASVSAGCSTYSSVLTLSGATLVPGITYQWQSSADGSTYTNITGATNSSYTATVSAPVYYQCRVTCTSSTLSATTAAIYLNEGAPAVSAISGATSVCVGANITLTDTTTSGSWTATGSATVNAVGVVTGTSAGTATISFSKSNGCATTSATYIVTVNPLPFAGTISGPSLVCPPLAPAYSVTATGGTWSSTGGMLSIGALSGMAIAVGTGTGIISYTVTNGCGSASATSPVTVGATPNAGTITGSTAVCATTQITLTDATSGGSWSVSNPIATSVTGGVVTGLSTGTSTISYTLTNICGTAYALYSITVNPQPNPGSISGNNAVCAGTPDTLTDIATGGSWTSTNPGVGNISSTGIVTTGTAGTTTISYTVTNGCGTSSATMILTVNPMPNAGTITGTLTVCPGQTITLSDASGGGNWSSTIPLTATVSGGVVSGLVAGTTTISYTVTNGCGTAAVGVVVTVNPSPVAGTISGITALCPGGKDTLSETQSGGSWSSSATGVITISGTGIDTAHTAGTATISYSVTNSCGTAIATVNATVNPNPNAGTITGSSSVCVLSSISLSDVAFGGVWSSSATGVASVVSGSVTGISAGTATISYTVTNTCGSASALSTITVNALPDTGILSGPSNICFGTLYPVTETVSGGTWSASNGSATITGSGLQGNYPGIDTIYYTVSNGCATLSAHFAVTVDPYPGTISGSHSVCEGSEITLSENVPGGTWTASNTNATVTGGAVSGNTAGVVAISYTVSTGCGPGIATYNITVNPLPDAGSLTGSGEVCTSGTTTLTPTISGGAWFATNGNATVAGGIVTGISIGTDTITYTMSNGCGSAYTTSIVTIDPAPYAGVISGGSLLCTGTPLTFSESVNGGSWHATNGNATIADSVASGVSAGLDTVLYVFTNSCGSDTARHAVTVTLFPNAGTITGASSVCQGQSITMSDAVSGGSWLLSNTSLAAITDSIITGVTSGADSVYYLVSNICGTDTAVAPITINPLPNAGTISGPAMVCVNSEISLSNAATGGAWASGGVHDTVSNTGIVYGVSAGIDTVWYNVINGCGNANAYYYITVNPLPDAGTISGSGSVCTGASVTLTTSIGGGSWTTQNSNLSIASGVITGMIVGTDTVFYSVTNICGTAMADIVVTINPTLSGLVLSGPSVVCTGQSITLTTNIPGGWWTAFNTSASVDSSGDVTGVHTGTDSMIYHVANMCSSLSAPWIVTVNQSADAGIIVGNDTLCKGNKVTLTDAATGGIWSTTTGTVTVNATGVVTAVSGGMDTVLYSVTNGCGTAIAQAKMVVNTLVSTSITGPSFVCVNKSDTLYGGPDGGFWLSHDTMLANVTGIASGTGIVMGKSPGVDTIYYGVTNSCGTNYSKLAITIFSAADCPTLVPGVGLDNTIHVYPNPTEGLLNVDLPATSGSVTLRIIDLYGKVVLTKTNEHNNRNLQIDLSEFAKGTYLLAIDGDGVQWRDKVVVW